MANAHEAFGQNVHQEPPHELPSIQPLGLDPGVIAVILISERDPVTVHRQEAPVADGDSVTVAGKIIHHAIGLVQAVSSVNNPLLLHQAIEHAINLTVVGNLVQFTGVSGGPQQRHHLTSETPG